MIGSHKVTLEIQPGASIDCAAEDAQWLANEIGRTVCFEFNGVKCFAVEGGDAKTLAKLQQAEQARKPRVFSDGQSE